MIYILEGDIHPHTQTGELPIRRERERLCTTNIKNGKDECGERKKKSLLGDVNIVSRKAECQMK